MVKQTPLVLGLQYAEWIVFAAVAFVTLRLWRRHRSPAAGWAAATFGTFLLVVVAAAAVGPNPKHLNDLFVKALIAVIVLFPYALFRFAATFISPSAFWRRFALVGVAAILVWTFLL